MNSKFKCKTCDLIFEAEGVKIEYISKIYGPCSKKEANCPHCDVICDEYITPKSGKSTSNPSGGCHGNCSCCC